MMEQRVQPESYKSPFTSSKFGETADSDTLNYLYQAKAAAERYLAAQFGRVRLLLRNLLFIAFFGLMVVVATVTVAIVATVQICFGAAGAIGALLGERLWAGELIVGLAILGGTCTFCWVAVSKVRKNARQKAMEGYIKAGALPVESARS